MPKTIRPSPAIVGQALGPASMRMLARAGIAHDIDLRGLDPVALFVQVKTVCPEASMNLLYGLVAAHDGCHWREVARERRGELLMRLDELEHAPR